MVQCPSRFVAAPGTHSLLGGMLYIAMRMTPAKRAFRFVALALAFTQLTVSEGASIYEAFATRHVGPSPSIASPGAQPGAPAHDPESCPACQTLGAFARVPEAPRLLLISGPRSAPGIPRDLVVPRLVTGTGFLSRAPPILPG